MKGSDKLLVVEFKLDEMFFDDIVKKINVQKGDVVVEVVIVKEGEYKFVLILKKIGIDGEMMIKVMGDIEVEKVFEGVNDVIKF